MNSNGQPLDLVLFEQNRSRISADQVLPYAGKFVAWSADGTRIVASAEDRAGLYTGVESAGFPVDQVVFDYIGGKVFGEGIVVIRLQAGRIDGISGRLVDQIIPNQREHQRA